MMNDEHLLALIEGYAKGVLEGLEQLREIPSDRLTTQYNAGYEAAMTNLLAYIERMKVNVQ